MLTKKERAEIATRFISYDGGTLYFTELFECLFNREIPGSTTNKEDTEAVIDRLIDLCDTSNMIELPLDKDGEVIHAGDVVYTSDGEEHKMAGYIMRKNTTEIILSVNSEGTYITTSANKLTHKKPVTIASLVGEIKRVANQEQVERKVYEELFRIAWELERLGDSDDNRIYPSVRPRLATSANG